MKLKRVELQGFKSFVDKTVLEFDKGITAILGPNGCGKSNIVDAIRWVLGEQSAKQLRGSTMEDIIFKGTAKRKAVNLCEVSLIFSNEDRLLPIEFDEVGIKRRVTRDGNSQYFLNNSPVRLKDLRDLFFDSGVNNTTYSVIEQEKIGRVLAENSNEVRLLIEERAGIVKYKARRKEAQRKLDQTQQDVLRLMDIVEEIGREVRSLQRQVGKARRYRSLYAQARALDLLMAGRGWKQMENREHELKGRVQELMVAGESDSGELAELRGRIESTRPAVDEREAERHGLEESMLAYESELKQIEQKVIVLEHRITDHTRRRQEHTEQVAEICSRRETVHIEMTDLGARRQTVISQVEELTSDLLRLEEELRLIEHRFDADRQALEKATQLNMEFIETDNRHKAELRELQVRMENRGERLRALEREGDEQREGSRVEEDRLTSLSSARDVLGGERRTLLQSLADTERALQDGEDDRSRLRDEISLREAKRESLSSRHDLLKRIKDSYHGYSKAAKDVLERGANDSRVRGSLADRLGMDEAWTEAFELLLGDLLDAVVVDGPDTATEYLRSLREGEKGRISLLPDSAFAGGDGAPTPPAGGRTAADLVRGEAAGVPHLTSLLSRTWCFETDEAALTAAAAYRGGVGVTCLSRTGLLVTSDGLIRGGSGKAEEVSLLGRGEKLDGLLQEIADLETQITDHQARLAATEEHLAALRTRVQDGRGAMEELDDRLRRHHVEEAEARSRVEAAARRLEAIARDRESIEASMADLLAQENALMGRLDSSSREREGSTTRLDDLRTNVVTGERERDGLRGSVGEKQLLHSQLHGESRELDTAVRHRQESVAEMTATEVRLREEMELYRQELEDMERELVERRGQVSEGVNERERRRRLVQVATESISALHEETAVWHERVKEIEDARSVVREHLHGAETELATMDVRRANLVERVEEQHKGRFRELIRSIDREALPKELEFDDDVFNEEQARSLLDDARHKLEGLGAVNHLAVEEFEQKNERLTFLETQLADVQRARDDLNSTITKINTTARKLFRETYEEVRRNYVAVFQTLFEGGRADLILEATDDPLEANIRILAQPRGKKVDHIRLLSGGERCLTALSILFAVYLVKPSPFCLLDEADAPLDDSNVQRFVHMLREFSSNTQFLVVTHNKLTMETANHLYGVTMMEEGVSNTVSVSFQDVAESHSDADLGRAIAKRRRQIDNTEAEHAVTAAAEAGEVYNEEEVRFTLDEAAAELDAINVPDMAVAFTLVEEQAAPNPAVTAADLEDEGSEEVAVPERAMAAAAGGGDVEAIDDDPSTDTTED